MALIALGQLLTDLASAHPRRTALTCGENRITWRKLESHANQLARAYEGLGVDQDDFVTLALPNSIEYVAALFAIWKLGATPAPISSNLPARERTAIIELTEPSLVVGVDSTMHPDRQCIPSGFEPPHSVSDEPIIPPRIARAWKAPTSGGSTGRPKVIVAGQSTLFETSAGAAQGMRPGGVTLIPGPLYHNAPLGMLTGALAMGNHVVLLPRFDAVAALAAIDAHGVDHVTLVPTMMLRMWRAIEEDPDRYDLSSLQRVWHTASACPAWLKETWIELVGPERLFEIYGGTEGQAFTVITGAEWLSHRGSVGRPWLGDVKVLDDAGNELPPGVPGEIYLRPPDGSSTYRYIGAEARARDDGWESLGDVGWMDDDGYLYVSDRRTDMIVSGGANVYPAEVEAALLEHDLVESAVVVGLPDDDLGQRLHAVVQTRAQLPDDDLGSFLARRLVRYKVPRSFRFVTEPLRDDAGKVRRSAIRDEETQRLGLSPNCS